MRDGSSLPPCRRCSGIAAIGWMDGGGGIVGGRSRVSGSQRMKPATWTCREWTEFAELSRISFGTVLVSRHRVRFSVCLIDCCCCLYSQSKYIFIAPFDSDAMPDTDITPMVIEDWLSCNISRFIYNTTKCGNYSDVLPLKASRGESTSNLTSFGASNLSCRRTQCRLI